MFNKSISCKVKQNNSNEKLFKQLFYIRIFLLTKKEKHKIYFASKSFKLIKQFWVYLMQCIK